jgi:hypothetical protein
LYLTRTRIETLPENIGNLSQLEKLSLSAYTMTSLPHSFLNLTNLERLKVDYHENMNITEAISIRTRPVHDGEIHDGVIRYKGNHTPITEYFPHFTQLDDEYKYEINLINERIREYRRHKLNNIARTIESMQSRKLLRKKYLEMINAPIQRRRSKSSKKSKRRHSAPTQKMYNIVKPKSKMPMKVLMPNSAPTMRTRSKMSRIPPEVPPELNKEIASYIVDRMNG